MNQMMVDSISESMDWPLQWLDSIQLPWTMPSRVQCIVFAMGHLVRGLIVVYRSSFKVGFFVGLIESNLVTSSGAKK